ncbi:MAG: tetratricopeptide repeat protein, partial [Defluviitaleaceae bacterium]|nr:tetratricopeptide repeat protein [Defluviitaleaceae bacterium]
MDLQQLNDIINGIVETAPSVEWLFSGIATNAIGVVMTSAGLLIGKIFSNKGKGEGNTISYVNKGKGNTNSYITNNTGQIIINNGSIDKASYKTEFANPISPEISSGFPHYLTPGAPMVGKEFIHREDIVEELHEAIKQNRKLALINGLGGIGKTTVARALYHKVKDEFKHIAWVEYQHSIEESLLTSFRIFRDIEDNDARYEEIKEFLLGTTQDTIIFIDNISNDDGLDFIKRLHANIILTSRLDEIGSFEIFPIDILSEEQCINIFYKYYKYDEARKQKVYVREIINLVKNHTLSIELLARAANTPRYPLEKYIADLKAKGIVYPELKIETDHTDVSQTIAKHLQVLFDLVSVSDEQKRILLNFALMPSIELPVEVENWLDCDVNDISDLLKLGWLSKSETGYEMHPIVKEAVLLQYNDEGIQYEDVETIVSYMSGEEYIKATDIYIDVRVRLNIAESTMSYICNIEKEEIGALFNDIAFAYEGQGDYSKALEYYQKASAICEKVLGKEHSDIAIIHNNIAMVYKNQGDYPKAMKWNYKALRIREKKLGVEHPDTATTYNNI